ncbi:mycofactocin system glycosyltransferase [Aeromicrobium sp. 636]|uniref:Mycofactocin biosynthesis glycosyltransferase MftF n=1 Tax=Aeromicrobium senzhongii TaxID=2663859 RepID=A0A8I0K2J5_9ACTN|nr:MULTISPECIES: mycofactocin biosynthesis glycosyltransferase MftF [Aeromicrobium]MBC9226464.1 mycofactocin biosynthesis glycosyltransferase MftF [Aeromicrobium senzhongii]MCQ3998568.1 mycofactocin system glycosyltransferase [Aeromicrobium sp. 636]
MSFDPRSRAVVRIDPEVRRHGQLLVGGSPSTVVRLTPRAFQLIRDDTIVVDSPAAALLADRLVAANLAHPVLMSLPELSAEQLTIVIPVKDREAELRRLLSRLGTKARVIVVDDGSSDRGSIAAAGREHGAHVIRLDVNQGPAAARNAGLAEVDTPFVAFVDSDVTIDTDGLLTASRHFADPGVAVVGPRVRGEVTTAGSWFQRYEQHASSLDLRELPTTVRPFARVSWLPSACLLARVSALEEGFDETMRVGEDVDLIWRVLGAGHRVVYEPAVEATHDARPRLRSWFTRKAFYGTGGADLHRRHGDLVAPAVLPPLPTLAVLAVIAHRRWSLPVAVGFVGASAGLIGRELPQVESRRALAVRLACSATVSSAWQLVAMALRHHWPVTVLLCLASPRIRRAVALAAVVDGLVDRRARGSRLGPIAHTTARRVDDVAYGTGLWWGAIRRREGGVLRPRVSGLRSPRRRARR